MTPTLIDLEEKRLEKLPPRELSRHLMGLPVKKRLDMILQRVDAEAVVAAMADHDFYFSVQEIGPDDALPLLALARVDQLNHVFDLEWWDKDHVRPAKAVEWLERLARASEDKLLSWLYHVDFELLVTLFKKWFQIFLTPEDMDLLEAMDQLPKNTLDDQYFWETRYPQYEEFFSKFLSLIFEVHYGFYKELMNCTIGAIDADSEEEAYQFHRGRLEDRAIPDFYNALEIYQSIRPEEIVPVGKILGLPEDSTPAPFFALALVRDEDLLGLALREINDMELLDTLQLELASLASKVMVADQLRPDSPEALRHSVEKAVAYVNLGLQIKSVGELQLAVKWLRDVFIEHLFRLGQTQVAILKRRMEQELKHGWLSLWPGGIKALDSDWMDSAELLLRKTPMLLRPSSVAYQTPREDFFRNRQDLSRGKRIIDVIASLRPLYEALRVAPEHLSLGLWPAGQIHGVADVTFGAMLWTAAAWFRLEGRWDVEPIPLGLWPALLPLLEPGAMESTIRSWVEGIVPDTAQQSLTESYLAPLFQAYAEEMAPFAQVKQGKPPDPQLVRFLIFKEE